MDYRLNYDWRNKRINQFHSYPINFGPNHCSIASYSTVASPDKNMDRKADLNEIFTSKTYLEQLHILPNPLQKNLADTMPKTYEKRKTNMQDNTVFSHDGHRRHSFEEPAGMAQNNRSDYPRLAGISNFISGVFNIISGAMPFQRRAKSPAPQDDQEAGYANCAHDDSPPLDTWLRAKTEPQNKNNYDDEQSDLRARIRTISDENVVEMSADCHIAAAQCEDKLAKVRNILVTKTITPKASPTRLRRPKKVFVEPGSVEERFDDAFSPEEFAMLPNDASVECASLSSNVNEELVEVEAPKIKTEMLPLQTDILKSIEEPTISKAITMPELSNVDICVANADSEAKTVPEMSNLGDSISEIKTQIIATCEDKVSKLKALLLERRKNNSKTVADSGQNSSDSIAEPGLESKSTERTKKMKQPVPTSKSHCKRHKNPHRLSGMRRIKPQTQRNIEEDMSLSHETDSEGFADVHSPLLHKTTNVKPINIPKTKEKQCYFNEISGRFHNSNHSSSVESNDSFQIVFSDSPKHSPRMRKVSDCESDDSFIVFEDGPDNCYTSTDVFGESEESDMTDSDSGDDDSSHKLAHNLSRTVSDLTDESLYDENSVPQPKPYSDSEDELDCAVRICDKIPSVESSADTVNPVEEVQSIESTGLLLNDVKKRARKNQPKKSVRFSEAPPRVRVMRVWAFAARQARAGHWEQHALDRERFRRRIENIDMAISWVLKPQHRTRVKFQRFMPWWNAQRRLEIAEKKAKDEADKIAKEEAERLAIIEAEQAEEERLIREEEERIAKEEAEKIEKEEAEKAAEDAKLAEERAKKAEEEKLLKEEKDKAAQEAADKMAKESTKRAVEEWFRKEQEKKQKLKLAEKRAKEAADKEKLIGAKTNTAGIKDNMVGSVKKEAIIKSSEGNNVEKALANQSIQTATDKTTDGSVSKIDIINTKIGSRDEVGIKNEKIDEYVAKGTSTRDTKANTPNKTIFNVDSIVKIDKVAKRDVNGDTVEKNCGSSNSIKESVVVNGVGKHTKTVECKPFIKDIKSVDLSYVKSRIGLQNSAQVKKDDTPNKIQNDENVNNLKMDNCLVPASISVKGISSLPGFEKGNK